MLQIHSTDSGCIFSTACMRGLPSKEMSQGPHKALCMPIVSWLQSALPAGSVANSERGLIMYYCCKFKLLSEQANPSLRLAL